MASNSILKIEIIPLLFSNSKDVIKGVLSNEAVFLFLLVRRHLGIYFAILYFHLGHINIECVTQGLNEQITKVYRDQMLNWISVMMVKNTFRFTVAIEEWKLTSRHK